MNSDVQQIADMLRWLIPIFIIEIAFLVIALIDIDRRKSVTGNNKLLWMLFVIFFGIIGPIVYFIFGRKNKTSDK